ncbi:MAG: hypothetical protein AAF499_10155 [Pseudomonadota bacterium]
MRFITALFASLFGFFGGLLLGLIGIATAAFWVNRLAPGVLSLTHCGLILGLCVLWGVVAPRHVKILFWPVMIFIAELDNELNNNGAWWGGSWLIGCVVSTAIAIGAVFVVLGALIDHALMGLAGTALFWLPFFAQFWSGSSRTARST